MATTPITPEQFAQARRTLGHQLAAHREAAGLTQAQLARLAGYTRSAIANLETGRSSAPRTSWNRYDQLLNASGTLLAGYDHYATLTEQHRQQAAQERERQRIAKIDQWRRAAPVTSPSRREDHGEGLGRYQDGLHIDRPLLGLGHEEGTYPGAADASSKPEVGREVAVTSVDPNLCVHWYEMLRILAAADDALGVHGLLDVVRAEVVLIDSHRQAARGRLRSRFTAVLARWLEFGSWVADNQQQMRTAERWLRSAASLADEAADTVHVGYLQMRRAQRAVEAGDVGRAETLADQVMRDSSLPARVRALAVVRHAQALAHKDQASQVRANLGLAYHLLDRAAGADDPAVSAMAGHCTSAYLRGYEAHCRLLLGEPEAAAQDFQLVLADWPTNQRLDEGLFRANLAMALDRAGQREAAGAEAATARRLATETGSRRTQAVLEALTADRAVASR